MYKIENQSFMFVMFYLFYICIIKIGLNVLEKNNSVFVFYEIFLKDINVFVYYNDLFEYYVII